MRSNFWILINLIPIRATDWVIPVATGATKFTRIDAKLYIPVVTLSAQDNTKALQQMKSGFKHTINWNKYQPKVTTQPQNQYLDFFYWSKFQGVNRLLVLSFENSEERTSHSIYYLMKVEIKYYNAMIDGRNVFDKLIKIYIKTW